MMANELLSNNENGRCGLRKVFLKEMTFKKGRTNIFQMEKDI